MGLLTGCLGSSLGVFPENPEFAANLHCLERVLILADQEKFEAALEENAKLERLYGDQADAGDDYVRVIMASVQINAALLGRLIQDEKKALALSRDVKKRGLTIKKLNSRADRLARKLRGMEALSTVVKNLETEIGVLQQQIKDFKEIDLKMDEINGDR